MSEILFATFLDAIFAAVAGLGFAYVSSPPKKTLFLTAFLAAIGHSFRFMLTRSNLLTISVATLLASFLIGVLGMIFAKKLKVPAEVIAFPALLPMVPGIYAYKSILALVLFSRHEHVDMKSYYLIQFLDNALITLSVSLALGVGVSITLLLLYEQALMSTRGARKFRLKVDDED